MDPVLEEGALMGTKRKILKGWRKSKSHTLHSDHQRGFGRRNLNLLTLDPPLGILMGKGTLPGTLTLFPETLLRAEEIPEGVGAPFPFPCIL